MKILSNTLTKSGRRRLIVEISDASDLMEVKPGEHYRLGEPMGDDVIAGHILAAARPVSWCSIEQKWV